MVMNMPIIFVNRKGDTYFPEHIVCKPYTIFWHVLYIWKDEWLCKSIYIWFNFILSEVIKLLFFPRKKTTSGGISIATNSHLKSIMNCYGELGYVGSDHGDDHSNFKKWKEHELLATKRKNKTYIVEKEKSTKIIRIHVVKPFYSSY